MASESSHRDIDRGWAWWVLFASYMNLLLCSGLSFVAGMFQVVFLQEFHGSVALTSWVTSLFSSFMQLGGPMSSIMANAMSCRAAVIVGGLCLSLGLSLSALGDSLGMLFAFFGVIAGVGLGLTYTASIVVINYYFHRRRTMVTGIALSSAGLGIMLGPQISTFLFQTFSWREALGMMSMASAQVCVLGALMFPMHETQKSSLISRISNTFKMCCPSRGNPDVKEHRACDTEATTNLVDSEVDVDKNDAGRKFIGSKNNISSATGSCHNGVDKPVHKDPGLKTYCDGMNGDHDIGVDQDTQSAPLMQSELITVVDDSKDICSSSYKQLLQAESEVALGSQTLAQSPNGNNIGPNTHTNHKVVRDLASINNSSRSLQEQASYHPHHHHHYFLKQHHHHQGNMPNCLHHRRSHSNLHSPRIHPKFQSFLELSTSANSNSNSHTQLNSIKGTFRSNRELHVAQPAVNQTSLHDRITTAALQGSTSHLHLTVVPHNLSLLSLVASTKHLDLVLHQDDDQPSSSNNHLLDNKHLLHSSLLGPGSETSDLRFSQTALKSSPSKRSILQATFLSESGQDCTKSAPAVISTSLSPKHVPGKDPNRPLYRNGAFLLLCVQLFVANCACGVFNIHMPSFSISKGLTDQEMTNILSLNGFALFNGRMLVGALASATGLDLLIYWALHMLGGLIIIILPVAGTSYFNFCFLIYGIGTFFGSVYSVLTTLTLKYVGLSRLATAFGVEMVCAGLGYLLAPPVAGLLVDLTESYDYNMYCGGALLILSALIVMFLPILEPEVTREDLRKFLAGAGAGHGDGEADVGSGQARCGIEVDVEVEDCGECLGDLPCDAASYRDGFEDNVVEDAAAADDDGGDNECKGGDGDNNATQIGIRAKSGKVSERDNI